MVDWEGLGGFGWRNVRGGGGGRWGGGEKRGEGGGGEGEKG